MLRVLTCFVCVSMLSSVTTQATAAAPATPGATKDALLVLDASGSMWGQIEGVNKIVIARDVLESLVLGMPTSQRMGLVAYGHRRKGDCTDIETLADVGVERDKLIEAIREVTPRGKTPLSASVMHAAEALNYTRNAANIILVSDGLETCDVDPCELAKTLEENGLDLTVHVVGFDVTVEERRGLECIAAETGGQFLSADNADELNAALVEVAYEPVAQETGETTDVPATLSLKATILPGGPYIQSELDWQVLPAAGGEPVFVQTGGGFGRTTILPGDYTATATWHGWRPDGQVQIKTGSVDFSVNSAQPKVITVPVDLELPVTLESPETTPEGVPFSVSWSGPDALGAFINVNSVEDSPRERIYGQAAARARDAYAAAARKDNPDVNLDTDGDGDFDQDDLATAEIGGPSMAGDYEVRYVLDKPRVVLARVPLEVTDSPYALQAPEDVPVSSLFDVKWSGPLTAGDFLTITPKGMQKAFANGYTAKLSKDADTGTLRAPPEPGEYEVRYVLANGYTLYPGMQHVVQATVPITVSAVSASVSGPAEAVGGSTVTLDVTKPPSGWEDDVIYVIPAGSSKINRDSWTRLKQRDGSAADPVTIQMPNLPGEYEYAYFLFPGTKVLARAPVKVTLAHATLDAPETGKMGEPFQVSYTGPAYKGDRIVITRADTPDSKMWSVTPRYGFFASDNQGTGTVRADAFRGGPGEYEVRYVTGLQHIVLARDPIRIEE